MGAALTNRGAVIDSVLVAWFVLTALSAAYVAWDALRNNPEMVVMKWGWLLVTLYTGLVGAALYVLSCKEPAPQTHERFVTPLWKQTLGSTIHCMAGDATGVIAAATVTVTLGLPMWLDVTAEYAFGFAFGLLVFQALFMRGMLGGSYARAVRKSFTPEWFSMNAVMSGMVPVMVVLMSRDVRSMEPTSLRYWGVMSLASLVGMALAFPINAWLVVKGLKHGMGTVRALGAGGHSVEAEPMRMAAMDTAKPEGAAGSGSSPPRMPDVPLTFRVTRPQLVAVGMLSMLQLGAGVLIAALAGNLLMRRIPSGAMPASMQMTADLTLPAATFATRPLRGAGTS